jgi:hypothetical protein
MEFKKQQQLKLHLTIKRKEPYGGLSNPTVRFGKENRNIIL